MAGILKPLKCNLSVKSSDINNNLNNLTTEGVYHFVDVENSVDNNPGLDYGMVIVLSAGYYYIMQIAFNSNNRAWIRFINSATSQFNNWKEL